MPYVADTTDGGATLIEYVLLVALIALAALAGVAFFGSALNDSLSRGGSELFPVIRPWVPWVPWLPS